MLGMQIAAGATMEEVNRMDFSMPGQIIRWAIKEGVSPNPAQPAGWDFLMGNLRGKKDPLIF